MKYIIRFLIVILFIPITALLPLFFVIAFLGNIFYFPIYFICNGKQPRRKVEESFIFIFGKYTGKFINCLIRKGYLKDE